MTSPNPDSPNSLHLPTVDGGGLDLSNPFRGTLIVGAPGSGKTSSLAAPMTEQFARKNFAGLIYSGSGALFSKELIMAMGLVEPRHEGELRVQRRTLDFYDLSRSEKVNLLRPELMESVNDAYGFAAGLLASLQPAASSNASTWGNFFTKASESYLAAIIWYYRQHHPALCTLPHVVATVAYDDFTHVLAMLGRDPNCQVLVQSLITAVMQNADKQVAGVIGSLQVETMDLLMPELCWLLTPDEAKEEGFSLNLNDPANPTLLTIGNDPTLLPRPRPAYSAVISCVIAVAMKQMNRANRHRSFVLLDDAQTIHLPGLEIIPATARANKLALVYLAQDMAQLIDAYGKDRAQVLVSSLNNQFIGRVESAETAELLASLVSKEELARDSDAVIARIQEAHTLSPGEFIGQFAGPEDAIFRCALRPPANELAPAPVEPAEMPEKLAKAMAENLLLVRQQVAKTLGNYPNSLSKENRDGQKP